MSDLQSSNDKLRVISGRSASDGAGVKLTRFFDARMAEITDPFLLLDAFGSEQPGDYIAGFPSHPHRGFETITYMLAGRMQHKDSRGNSGDLGPGSVQWMTAGRGIIHSEMPQQESGLLKGFQLWLNLPSAEKMCEPAYQDLAAALIPEVKIAGGIVRVISGSFAAAIGPVRPRPTEPLYLDFHFEPNAACEVPIADGHSVIVHAYEGSLQLAEDARKFTKDEIVLSKGKVHLKAGEAGAKVLVIAGKPLGEPVAHYGPFVMNTKAEIEQTLEDYRAGNLA